jgi:2-polyprenyl-3-methyl-5-hydroxy-6-metoxy-1,4-benzoquinol methylase
MTSSSQPGSVRYARALNLDDRRNAHTLAVLLVGGGSRVLDIGTSTGTVAAALRDHGAHVWGVEIDADAAKEAAKVCEQMVIGNVEQLDLDAELEQREFDWLLLLDVLEHLLDPLAVLKRCSSLLAPDGRVLISIPNVAHTSVRVQLLRGHFEYTETGLLDRTHLRFFDQDSVRELLAAADLDIEEELPIRRALEEEGGVELESLSPDVMRELESDSASDIYQFIIVARRRGSGDAAPASENGSVGASATTTLLGQLWSQVDELEKQVRGGERYVTSLLERISELELRAEYGEELKGVIAERMSQLSARDRELKQLRLTLGLKERQLVDMRELLATAMAEAAATPPLRDRLEVLEWEHAEMVKRMAYGRYRAADWLSRVVKGIPGLHGFAKLVVESVFGRRR